MRPLVFDLDQTLIRGEVQDWTLWLAAVGRALGVQIPEDEDWAAFPVHTDHGLVHALSWKYRGRPFGIEERLPFEAELLASTDALLQAEPQAFRAIDGAAAALSVLAPRASLATGNLHAITGRKLRAAGLDSLGLDGQGLPCSCSKEGIDRTELVRRALQRRGWREGQPATSFGDGPWDLRAARDLGIGFVGIAATPEQVDRLRAAGARHVLPDYQDLDLVLRLCEEAEPPGPEQALAPWQAPRA